MLAESFYPPLDSYNSGAVATIDLAEYHTSSLTDSRIIDVQLCRQLSTLIRTTQVYIPKKEMGAFKACIATPAISSRTEITKGRESLIKANTSSHGYSMGRDERCRWKLML